MRHNYGEMLILKRRMKITGRECDTEVAHKSLSLTYFYSLEKNYTLKSV